MDLERHHAIESAVYNKEDQLDLSIPNKEDLVTKEESARQFVGKNDDTKSYSETQVFEAVKHMEPFHQDIPHTASTSEILEEKIDVHTFPSIIKSPELRQVSTSEEKTDIYQVNLHKFIGISTNLVSILLYFNTF